MRAHGYRGGQPLRDSPQNLLGYPSADHDRNERFNGDQLEKLRHFCQASRPSRLGQGVYSGITSIMIIITILALFFNILLLLSLLLLLLGIRSTGLGDQAVVEIVEVLDGAVKGLEACKKWARQVHAEEPVTQTSITLQSPNSESSKPWAARCRYRMRQCMAFPYFCTSSLRLSLSFAVAPCLFLHTYL